MKKFIKKLLNQLGIVAFKRASRVYLPEDDAYRIAVERCGQQNPLIIDGGAHRGGSVSAFSLFAPQAEFHCFEPDPILTNELRTTFRGRTNVNIVESALGRSSGQASFNINASRPTNSLLPAAEGIQADLQALCQVVDQVEVQVVSIDEYCETRSIARVDILKLDLQGYDYEALRGAERTLETVSVVQVEVLFTEIYRGCKLFPDVLALMLQHGFYLYTLCGIHYGKNDELLWSDAIFVRV